MKRKPYKIGFIASSIKLINDALEISEKTEEDIQVSVTGLDEAISVGMEMEANGVEVIVSRGGTSHMLRESLNIPVLSIPLTSFDILTSVKKASELGNRIMISTFRNKISGLELLEDLFKITFMQGVYHSRNSLEQVIIDAKNQGYEVFIGGGVSLRLASHHDLKVVEIQTAKETIASIIEDAKSVAKSRREEREKAQRYQSIIDSTSEGIIAVDQDGFITAINRTARAFMKNTMNNGIGKHISQFVPHAKVLKVIQTKQPEFNCLEVIDKDQFVSNNIPILVESKLIGGVSTFKDVSNVMKAENEVRRSFAKGLVAKYQIKDFVHESSMIRDIINRVLKFADSDSTLLISGESGTGKEILAHSIHNLSQRKKGPLVSINCSALPDQLLESELFGYDEGAFTGSRRGGKPGLFEIAHNGTIFLDEIGTTPKNVQARLLRVLQEKEVMRIGSDRIIPINVRVLSATNKDLTEEVQKENFREDLFFRINVLHIHIPALRDRIEDIPCLVKTLIKRASKKYGLKALNVPDSLVETLLDYSWPGNVRQLEAFLERLILLTGPRMNNKIFKDLFQELCMYPPLKPGKPGKQITSLKDSTKFNNMEYESKLIRDTLQKEGFSKTRAAKKLGVSRTTLWRKLKNLDLVDQP